MLRRRGALFGFGLALTVSLAGCGSLDDKAAMSSLAGNAQTCPGSIAWQSTQLPSGNVSLLRFATAKQGVKVGNGQCSDMPDQGLRSQHYKTFSQLGPTGNDADYVWGKPVATITTAQRRANGVLAGDVVQFRNFSQKVVEGSSWWTSKAQHHSAVVKAVSSDGKHLCVFEQNINGRQTVGTGYISLNAMDAGTLWVYRPTL